MSTMISEIAVAQVGDVCTGQRKLIFVKGRSLLLFNVEGRLHAIDNSCPHNGASLATGRLDGTVLQCPAHGLRFDLATGCMPGTSGLCLKTYAIQEADGHVVIRMPDDA